MLIFAFLVSVGVYAWWTDQEPDRYNWFDFFRGKPIPEVPAESPDTALNPSVPAPVPSAAVSPTTYSSASPLGTRLPNGALLAQAQPATAPSPSAKSPRARPIDTARAGKVDAANIQILEQVNRAMADLTDAVVPAVVCIDTSTTVNVRRYVPVDPFGLFGYQSMDQEARQPDLGSGVLVSKDGYVLTNHHVIAGVDEIQITTHEGETFEAEWVGSDPGVDIAVLKLKDADDRAFPHLQFANSDDARVGETVLAVRNPFGLTETVTRSIISAKQRRLSDGANEYFQTDTVINPGNSGGPLR